MEEMKLTFKNQLDFKDFIKNRLVKDFYFDNIDTVDSSTNQTIPGLKADGTLTYSEAINILKKEGYLE